MFGVLCRFTNLKDQDGGARLVGLVINLRAVPVAVAVVARHSQAAVGGAVELRSGAIITLGAAGKLLSAGQVLVLQLPTQ